MPACVDMITNQRTSFRAQTIWLLRATADSSSSVKQIHQAHCWVKPAVSPVLLLVALALMLANTASAQNGTEGWAARGSAAPVQNASSPIGSSTNPQQSPIGSSQSYRQADVTPTPANRVTHAQISSGDDTLPNDHGQKWRKYDITPYTMRVEASERPEQAIVDWVLRETGYEAWHGTPFSILNANRQWLTAYHTPQMQAVVADIVDRFVNTEAERHSFGLRIITLKNPNWRTRALPLMTSIPVESPGVQGWIMPRENAALLLSELRRRTDYREHNPPHQMVLNGQSVVVSSMRPVSYTKGIVRTEQVWPGYQPEIGKLDEGFTLEFAPLLSMDTFTTDAVVKLQLAQVERMLPVTLEVPSQIAPNQRTQVQVPQMTAVQLHERFRWPTDQVLLLSMGVVAAPGPEKPNLVTDMLSLPKQAPRADALLMIESRGPVAPEAPGPSRAPLTASRPEQSTFHGRY